MDCTWDAALLRRGQELPPELVQAVKHGSNEQYLRAITKASHNPRCTYILFAHCEDIFAQICATLGTQGSFASTIATLGRIVPFASYLLPYAEQLLANERYTFSSSLHSDEDSLYLLGLFRLFSFEWRTFKKYVKPTEIAQLLESPRRPVVYLAIRILQIYLSGADHWFETMVKRYLGHDTPEDDINGRWDDMVIDYRFLTLWEEDRYQKVLKLVENVRSETQPYSKVSNRVIPVETFDPSTGLVGGILLPRALGGVKIPRMADDRLVHTSTISNNLKQIASALKAPRPLLLTGLAGSGKTLLLRNVAHKLGKLDQTVILHLNEQSDAKSLVGIYTTGDTPGSFVWKPGVLTTAVQEGRWVLIEDLDRAPNEIIGTLLPLIENGELVIPSRKQTIYASQGFRIVATVRTTITHRGEETKPLAHMLGARHWQSVSIEMPRTNELKEIASHLNPSLAGLLPQLVDVYQQLQASKQAAFSVGQSKTGMLRAISPRDLLKWCSRTTNILSQRSTFTSNDMDDVFLEAIDCFVGSLPDGEARADMAALIAEELRIDPQRRDYLLGERDVPYGVDKTRITLGRYSLTRSQQSKKAGNNLSSFSTNPHTNRMLERVAAAVINREPLLLVGETGVGKTTAVQHLAGHLGKKLVPFNLSQQSEAGDLLGGFKPISARSIVIPMKDEFDELFGARFSFGKNQQFLDILGKQTSKGNWKAVCKLWQQALRMVDQQRSEPSARQGEAPSKKRKVESKKILDFSRWDAFAAKVTDLERRLSAGTEAFAFSFVEGNIVKALRNGDWVLLDEINLASPDTLECMADLLDPNVPSLLLTESGSIERIEAHPYFRLFAAMNPATDIGKKDLPPGIRSRFTELYVESPDKDIKSLQSIVHSYLLHQTAHDQAVPVDISKLYQNIRGLAEQNKLVDGAGQKPHFSLRTLTRTLSYAKYIAPMCNLRRALYEGFQMNFMTFLDSESSRLVQPLLEQSLFGKRTNIKAELQKALRMPTDSIHVQGYPGSKHWVRQGNLKIEEQPHYILTPFIRNNLENLVRATSSRQFPVLIQGPTSSGKTSMIEYLAKRTGHQFVRINNHEHTDLQEYLGTYVSGLDGRLQFQEGLLVKALREGHWIVLDELNLAPTDVLEALNRLLDDNRELLIPETQQVVRPHENFMLFATQNPAGLYGGRKTLSRAFRNRFLELHFDDIPVDELQEILHRRTQLPESRCKRIVAVYRELSVLRQEQRLFEQKSFATLRDLFRWALRPNDTIEQLAANGFMLLAERVRKAEERQILKATIEKAMSSNGPRVSIDESLLYSQGCPEIARYQRSAQDQGVVWTRAMRRLYCLVARAIENNEPVLLVGETGCGKTTVCQMLADAFGKELHSVNAHQNTETGDLIGSQRPVRNRAVIEANLRHQLLSSRLLQNSDANVTALPTNALLDAYDHAVASLPTLNRTAYSQSEEHAAVQTARTRFKALFEWVDGGLVQALKQGAFFLLDEISLADDSVLERINSVLEPQPSILLAEKGSLDSFVTASPGFQIFATMNPGGDYGKRELSPALRNRFTEMWVPPLNDAEDVIQIVQEKLIADAKPHATGMVVFAQWFNGKYNTSASSSVSIRDALSWVSFVNAFAGSNMDAVIVHGAAMVYIDTLGANPAGLMTMGRHSIDQERKTCLSQLSEILGLDAYAVYSAALEVGASEGRFTVGPYSLTRKKQTPVQSSAFSFEPPTTKANTMRVVRALQLPKPVLLEGNPGVGKTALVTAIANAVGIPVTRINLSEQTDLIDLFGSDVPVEGAETGTFTWRDAPFLRAMKSGQWVLLDEMNLASQSVLEGLNACLDHRGEVFVPELGQTFQRHPDFCLFAAQNPHHQGGGRKGLPASFVNRFTVVFADAFRFEDLILISRRSFPQVDPTTVEKLIALVDQLDREVAEKKHIGANGAPWEFNLRDIFRALSLASSDQGLLKSGTIRDVVDFLFSQRFRSATDQDFVRTVFSSWFEDTTSASDLFCSLSSQVLQIGIGLLPRDPFVAPPERLALGNPTCGNDLRVAQSMMLCVQQGWPVILTGASGVGKTLLIEKMASAVGANLATIPMNAESDAIDLIGGYDQSDPQRQMLRTLNQLRTRLSLEVMDGFVNGSSFHALSALESCNMTDSDASPLLLEVSQGKHSDETEKIVRDIQKYNQAVDNAQFEWIDGILIEALQEGKWVVLDNANLCSPSVLDRLNSLLESDGVLIVNEHSNDDGSPRLIRPHPGFRIFLTVDPRYGELSRAMRNRAVELHLSKDESTGGESRTDLSRRESMLSRLRQASVLGSLALPGAKPHDLPLIVADHVGFADEPLVSRFSAQLEVGLYGLREHCQETLRFAWSTLSRLRVETTRATERMYESVISQKQVPTDFARVQTVHPLNNQALIPTSQDAISFAASVAFAFHHSVHLCSMDVLLNSMKSNSSLVATLGRLERSLNLKLHQPRPQAKTTSILSMLQSVLDSLSHSLGKHLAVGFTDLSEIKLGTGQVIALCKLLLEAIEHGHLDAATLHAFLSVGESIAHSSNAHALTETYNAFHSMGGQGERETRQACAALWKALRPPTPATADQLEGLLRFETVVERFDKLCHRFEISLQSMVNLRESFSRALDLAVRGDHDSSDLSRRLEDLMLESDVQNDHPGNLVSPHFCQSFKRLYEHFSVLRLGKWHTTTLDLTELEILALRRTKDGIPHSDVSRDSLQNKFRFLGSSVASLLEKPTDVTSRAVSGSFVLQQLTATDQVSLSRLELLETETTSLGKIISSQAHLLEDSGISALDSCLENIVSEVLHTLRNGTEDEELQKAASTLVARISSNDGGVVSGKTITSLENSLSAADFSPALKNLNSVITYLRTNHRNEQDQLSQAANAWARLSFAYLELYVPRTAFDPALHAQFRRRVYCAHRGDLTSCLKALQTFRNALTGESDTLRARLLEKDIAALGEGSPAVPIFRPKVSQFSELQLDLDGLMRTLQPLWQNQGSGIHSLPLNSNQLSNTVGMRRRLSEQYRAYDDFTRPIVGFIDCLLIAQRLTSQVRSVARQESRRSPLANVLPFVRANLKSWLFENYFVDAIGALQTDSEVLCWLSALSVRSAISPPAAWGRELGKAIKESFYQFYLRWRAELKDEQKSITEKSSVYKFRQNDTEQDEPTPEELEELFPTGGETANIEPAGAPAQSARELGHVVASLHSRIFRPQEINKDSIPDLLRQWMHIASASREDDDTHAIVTIMQAIGHLNSTIVADDKARERTNIYSDPNITEAKKLLILVKKIVKRCRELQHAWPEHAVPTEALRWCEELLEAPHTTPLSRLLPRMENLYATLNEWQTIASREFSVSEQLDGITSLIIEWRRLELSTWAGLFDREWEQCQRDAASWWYIAYEAIIAATVETYGTTHELVQHAEGLLKTLGDFAASSGLGEFAARLQMLRGFESHLTVAKDDAPGLDSVRQALANFNGLYAHFDKIVAEKLSQGRIELEKEVKSAMQVASWKDRNIEVLRQSAQFSHKKLLRIVRKFRALLAQPVALIIQGGVPREPSTDTPQPLINGVLENRRYSDIQADLPALPVWHERPVRFRNITATADLITKKARVVHSVFSAPQQLKSFVRGLEQSIEELQKSTPVELTEKNKALVSHLKTRKRRLLADVLKDVRHMGFQTAISEQILAQQTSTHTIFVRLPTLDEQKEFPTVASADYEFHRLLSIMPTVRESARKHADDLTPAEVTRCVFLLESILQVNISHRRLLSNHVVLFTDLDKALHELANFGLCEKPQVKNSNMQDRSIRLAAISYLQPMLDAGLELLRSQRNLSKQDYSELLQALESKQLEVRRLRLNAEALHLLPPNIQSSDDASSEAQWISLTNELRSNVENALSAYPEVGPILAHLLRWADISSLQSQETDVNNLFRPESSDWVQSLFGTLDFVLASVQEAERIANDAKTADSTGWLLDQQRVLDESLKSLRMSAIAEQLRGLMSGLQHIDSSQAPSLQMAAVISRAISPIAEAYRRTLADLITLFYTFHAQTSHTGYTLAESFIQIATRGFCSPSEKQDNSAESGNVESATGLGEGEGGEDISKEVGEGEDLSEIAQEARRENKEQDVEDEKDAVDMADEEMEGDLGDVPRESDVDQGDGDDQTDETADIDEEAGDGGLGPTAVDEKMWDSGHDGASQEKQAETGTGEPSKDDHTAAAEQLANDEMDQDEGTADEPESVTAEADELKQNADHVDPHVDEGTNLNLPEDMEPKDVESIDGLESDMESLMDVQNNEEAEPGSHIDDERVEDDVNDGEMNAEHELNEDQATQDVEDAQTWSNDDDDTSEMQLQRQQEHNLDEIVDGAVFGEGVTAPEKDDGAGEASRRQNQLTQEAQDPTDHSAQEQSHGDGTGAEKGNNAPNEPSRANEDHSSMPLKQIGDILEQWYNQHRQIEDARQPQEASDSQKQDMDLARAQFEHLPNDDAEADTQALGAASAEQSATLDENNAIASNNENRDVDMRDGDSVDQENQKTEENTYEDPMQLDLRDNLQEAPQPSSFVGEPRNANADPGAEAMHSPEPERDEVEDVDERLTNTHISHEDVESELSFDEARSLWIQHEESTRNLALMLTEHLRLILHPTQATKMRGDFRTGKRLNIRRIIPYIASSYKRDKIWMRRSVPTKRSYQVMLAIDDSKSMTENHSSGLAYDTLALVAKSMSMLEVGELSVVGFGEDVKIARDFSTSFTADEGAHIFQHFTFSQNKTNVQRLLAESNELFRSARLKATGSSSDLWQLQLIISDGICEDHPSIRQLVRQAHEERIMIVFIVVDPAVPTTSSTGATQQSILDLQTAEFVTDAAGDMQLKMTKYLDSFPFRYYLIVRNVQELPGVLAGALRQWFAEVVETSG